MYLKSTAKLRFILEKFVVLVCVGLVWGFLSILNETNVYEKVYYRSCRTRLSELVSAMPWVRFPHPFQWGSPVFDLSYIIGMMGATFVSSAESIVAFYAASKAAGATAPPQHVISRGICIQGIGQFVDGVFGGVFGTAASLQNIGLVEATSVGSRRVIQVTAILMLVSSTFAKVGAVFTAIPSVIYVALYSYLYCMYVGTGLSCMQFMNTNSRRNKTLLATTLFLAYSIANHFEMKNSEGILRTKLVWFNDAFNAFLASGPAVAMLIGTLFDLTLEVGSRDKMEQGLPWWSEKFDELVYGYPSVIKKYIIRNRIGIRGTPSLSI